MSEAMLGGQLREYAVTVDHARSPVSTPICGRRRAGTARWPGFAVAVVGVGVDFGRAGVAVDDEGAVAAVLVPFPAYLVATCRSSQQPDSPDQVDDAIGRSQAFSRP